jgi:hypothetical protein
MRAETIVPERASAAFDALDRPSAKQRLAVQREVSRLLDDLAPTRPAPRVPVPHAAVAAHRAPGRCVLQAAQGAVSVSWFPAHVTDDALGEMQVVEWRGVVSIPGSAQRAVGVAVAVDTFVLLPVEVAASQWEWRTADGGRAYATAALAAYCRGLLDRLCDVG